MSVLHGKMRVEATKGSVEDVQPQGKRHVTFSPSTNALADFNESRQHARTATTTERHHRHHHYFSLNPNNPKTRWFILGVFCVLSASNGFQWINFAPIVEEVKEYFHMDALQVNFLATIYTIVYPATIFLGCIAFQRFGSWGGMLLGAVLNTVGASLKIVAVFWAPNYGLLATTQIINALSEVFFLSLPPLLAATWFNSHQRTFATSIGVMSNSLGTAFGFIVPPLVVTPTRKGAAAFGQLFGWQAVVALLVTMAMFFLPRRPFKKPSNSCPRHFIIGATSLTAIFSVPPFVFSSCLCLRTLQR